MIALGDQLNFADPTERKFPCMRALPRIQEYLLCIVYKYYIPYLVIDFTTACPGVRIKSNFAHVRIGKGGERAKSLGTKNTKLNVTVSLHLASA